jgi:hypothetical protein
MAKPSKVEVPLPSSSIIAKERLVPCYNILLVSYISIKNVLFPNYNLSEAPILVKILSTTSQL